MRLPPHSVLKKSVHKTAFVILHKCGQSVRLPLGGKLSRSD